MSRNNVRFIIADDDPDVRFLVRNIIYVGLGISDGPVGIVEGGRRGCGIGGNADVPAALELELRAEAGGIEDGLGRRECGWSGFGAAM